MFEIFSYFMTYDRIHGDSDEAYQNLMAMNKSDKILQTSPKNDYLCNKMSVMSIAEWIEEREIKGFPTFSHNDVKENFPTLNISSIANELCRLNKKKRIQSVHKGFYTAVPLPFKEKGVVPPYNYIGQLMNHLGRPYYISLLSAGVLNGAAHQRPQRMSVTTVLPRISNSEDYNPSLVWNYKKEIPRDFLLETNSDTGIILYSNPELTAIDLVQYNNLIGGLSVAGTIMEELAERLNFEKYGEKIIKITTFPTLQRLGYILEVVLDKRKLADSLYSILQPNLKQLKYRPLSTEKPTEDSERNTRWKLLINQEIEIDEW